MDAKSMLNNLEVAVVASDAEFNTQTFGLYPNR